MKLGKLLLHLPVNAIIQHLLIRKAIFRKLSADYTHCLSEYVTRQSSCVTARGVPPAPPTFCRHFCVAIFVSPFFVSPFFVSPFFVSPFSQKKKKKIFSSKKKISFFKQKKN